MTYDRVELRRTKRGPVIALLFGVTIEGQQCTAEVMFVPEPIKRPVQTFFQTHKFRIGRVNPDIYGAVFGSEVPALEVLNGR